MRIDSSSRQFSSDDTQQMLRVARTARAAAGGVVVGAIFLAMGASMVPDLFDRPSADSVAEMQSSNEPVSAILDEGLSSLEAVTHHG